MAPAPQADGPGQDVTPRQTSINDPRAPSGRRVGELKAADSQSRLSAAADPPEIELGSSGSLSGTLTDSAGNPLPGREIHVYNSDTEDLIAQAMTADDGSFTVEVIPDWLGTSVYDVYYDGDAEAGWALDDVRVEAVSRFQLTAVADPATVHAGEEVAVSGRLINRDGSPVVDAEVAVVASPEGEAAATARTDGEGNWRTTFTVPTSIWTWGTDDIGFPEYWISAQYDVNPDDDLAWDAATSLLLTLAKGDPPPRTPSATPAPDQQPSLQPVNQPGGLPRFLTTGGGLSLLLLLLGIGGAGLGTVIIYRRRR